ncbi:MAG: GlsB/YeaQ/YmgE family stress response membrane protein [Aestuariivirgaceae bacterium]|nr:GlsB/YeaQ/YmgE family stress response membrane protein [Aestuariivirgaceae bacterium]
MSGVGFFGTLLIGALAGWIAEKVTASNMGLLMNILLGIVGSYVGAFIAGALGLQLGGAYQGWFWGNLLISAAGAILPIWIVRMVRGR